MKNLVMLAVLLPLAACVEDTSGPATSASTSYGTQYDLTSFRGARAGQSEAEIMDLGYTAYRTEGLTTYWLNSSANTCARITTADGRYQTVTMIPATDC
ncbi:hypothetical protein [Salipiger sp.]|uniref:hypothetical protein n=1 Tax=Salipiger sp. TaxID=2078585 RepID=UPI003A968EDB